MNFETERLILRPWAESDAESLYEYAKDPKVGPIAGWQPHQNVEASRQIIRDVFSGDETYAVCLKEDNRAIGCIGLMPPMHLSDEPKDNEMEIGYWLGVPFWGQGLIPEAAERLIAHAFDDLGIYAVWGGYYDGNEQSRRVLEKCGLTYHHTEADKPCEMMGDIRTEHYMRLEK